MRSKIDNCYELSVLLAIKISQTIVPHGVTLGTSTSSHTMADVLNRLYLKQTSPKNLPTSTADQAIHQHPWQHHSKRIDNMVNEKQCKFLTFLCIISVFWQHPLLPIIASHWYQQRHKNLSVGRVFTECTRTPKTTILLEKWWVKELYKRKYAMDYHHSLIKLLFLVCVCIQWKLCPLTDFCTARDTNGSK